MTVHRYGRLWRSLNHPWLVGILGGAVAGILGTYGAAQIFGGNENGPPPSLSTRQHVHVSLTPTLLSRHGYNGKVHVDASGLTRSGPVATEIDEPFGSIRGTRYADERGRLSYTEEELPDKPPAVGTAFRIVITDEATGASGQAYVQIVK